LSEPEYVARNRASWTQANADYTDPNARRAWSEDGITWGVFGHPESEIGVLGDVDGLDVVELGCGTAYFSARLARRGARPVGIDLTPAQLETAQRMQEETGIRFPLVEANAESVPLPDASFDLVLSEYGASLWCDPYLWIPEAHRLLRPSGRLVFMTNAPLEILCAVEETDSTSETLQRPQRGLHRLDWSDGGTEFHLGHGDMFRLLRDTGFEVEDLIELYASDDADTHPYYSAVPVEWARKWPAEEIWAARKR
jgi:SAM-dependent methyltransferase